jgi:Holliday junction resolvase
MASSQYRKGARKEYKIVKQLKEKGFEIAQRSAGSHSPVDVWGVNLKTKEILLIQSKAGKTKKEEEYSDLIGLDELFRVRFVLE